MVFQRPTPTLSDVARHAGVSTATVSRCLNAPERVVSATRDKVMEAVNTLGYSPNFGARVMAAKRTNTIGAIIPTMENAIFARGLQAFQEELDLHGYTLLVASSSYNAEMEEKQIRSLIARGADGLLLIGHDRAPAILTFLNAQNVPALAAWVYDANAYLPSIGFNNHTSMRTLADQVIALGHIRLGMISATTQSNDRARARVDGVREAMGNAGLDPPALTLIETVYSIDAGANAFAELMGGANPPTAILCGNDVLAVGAMKQARQMGHRVPDDISITGFDDMELAQVVDPGLTTVHVPHREMGRRAARLLMDMVTGKSGGQSTELAVEIVLRGSLARRAPQ